MAGHSREARTRSPISWDGIYRRKGEAGVSWFQDSADRSMVLLEACGVATTASVVDVGAGASRFVDGLLARGHRDVTLVDISEAGLEQARERLSDLGDVPAYVVADLLTWQPGRTFEVWHDRAVFHFLTTVEDRDRYRDLIHAATEPGSVVLIATFAEDGPTTCSGQPTERYSPAELAAEIGDQFIVLHSEREEHHTPGGIVQPFTWLALRRT